MRVYTWSGFWQIQAFEQWIRSLRSQNEFIAKSDKELSKCTARRSDSARVCERSLPRSDWCSQGLTGRHANVAFPGLTEQEGRVRLKVCLSKCAPRRSDGACVQCEVLSTSDLARSFLTQERRLSGRNSSVGLECRVPLQDRGEVSSARQ